MYLLKKIRAYGAVEYTITTALIIVIGILMFNYVKGKQNTNIIDRSLGAASETFENIDVLIIPEAPKTTITWKSEIPSFEYESEDFNELDIIEWIKAEGAIVKDNNNNQQIDFIVSYFAKDIPASKVQIKLDIDIDKDGIGDGYPSNSIGINIVSKYKKYEIVCSELSQANSQGTSTFNMGKNGNNVVSYRFTGGVNEGLVCLKGSGEMIGNDINLQYKQIKYVIMDDQITTVAANLFMKNDIEYVKLSNSVTVISGSSFRFNNLKTIKFPDSLETIGGNAFDYNQLTDITFSNNIKTIGTDSFAYNQIKKIIIPDSVTFLDTRAFQHNKIKELIIGNGIEIIKYSAFAYNEIESIVIPNSIKTIEGSAFGDNKLKSVVLGDSIESIGYAAFRDNDIESLNIPNSLKTIEDFAFNNNLLTLLTFPSGVANFYRYTFESNGPNRSSSGISGANEGTWKIVGSSWIKQ